MLALRLALTFLSVFISSCDHAFAQVGPGGYTPRPCVNLTDGTNTVSCASKITVTGGTVGGANPNATLTVTGGGGSGVSFSPSAVQGDIGFMDVQGTVTYIGGNSGMYYTGAGSVQGNVGIGSTHPGNSLDVLGTVRALGAQFSTYGILNSQGYTQSGSATNTFTGAIHEGSSAQLIEDINGNVYTTGNGQFGGGTGSTSVFAVDGGSAFGTYFGGTAPTNGIMVSGNVGIGTTNLLLALQVQGSIGEGTYLVCTQQNNQCNFQTAGSYVTGATSPLQVSGGNVSVIGSTGSGTNFVLQTSPTTTNETLQGTVGIGTTNIAGTGLDVQGTIQTSSLISANLVGTDGSGKLIANNTSYISTLLPITLASPNVGIGTTNPLLILQVQGAIGEGTYQVCTQQGTQCPQSGGGSTNPGGTYTEIQYNNSGAFGGFTGFTTNGTNVGIGTASYASTLNIQGSEGIAKNAGDSYLQNIVPSGSLALEGNVGIGTFNPANGALIIASGQGNVGIGSLAPGQALDVWGTTRFLGTAGVGIGTSLIGGANTAQLAIIGGNVGIGTWLPYGELVIMKGNIGLGSQAPGSQLDVQGTARLTGANNPEFIGEIQPTVVTVTQSATPTITVTNANGTIFSITGLAQAITGVTVSGTSTNGEQIEVQITDNATARAITWGSSFESTGNIALPTTTVISTMLRTILEYNSTAGKWDCIGVA